MSTGMLARKRSREVLGREEARRRDAASTCRKGEDGERRAAASTRMATS